MIEQNLLRKPKLHFDSAPRPSHVTFDDGREQRLNMPWADYAEARWDYGEPDAIKVRIGEWLVIIHGHNLGPLFQAMEDHTLTRVRAQPRLRDDRENERDTFVIEIRFAEPHKGILETKRPGQIEFDLKG